MPLMYFMSYMHGSVCIGGVCVCICLSFYVPNLEHVRVIQYPVFVARAEATHFFFGAHEEEKRKYKSQLIRFFLLTCAVKYGVDQPGFCVPT